MLGMERLIPVNPFYIYVTQNTLKERLKLNRRNLAWMVPTGTLKVEWVIFNDMYHVCVYLWICITPFHSHCGHLFLTKPLQKPILYMWNLILRQSATLYHNSEILKYLLPSLTWRITNTCPNFIKIISIRWKITKIETIPPEFSDEYDMQTDMWMNIPKWYITWD